MNIIDANTKIKNLAWYVKNGFVLLPLNWLEDGHCSCGQNGTCKSPGKHPLTKNGLHDASDDWDVVEGWHKQWPHCNWGARTGSIDQGGSNIVVVDIDKKSNGFSTWDMLRNEHPEPIQTATVATGGGGQHQIFTYPEGHVIKSGTNVLGPGIDIRANGGYIVIPPSATEAPYEFEVEPPFSALPDWMLKKLAQPKKEKIVIPQTEPVNDVALASNALNALSKMRADDYDQCLHVGMALCSLGNDGLLLWDTWCKQSDKYEPGWCAQKWETFSEERNAAEKITFGSLIHWAEEDGCAPFVRPCPKDAKPADYAKALKNLGYMFCLNEMNDEIYVNGRPWSDPLAAKIMNGLRAHGYKSTDYAKDTMLETGLDNQFHPIRDYLNSLEWQSYELDGKTYHPDFIDQLTSFFKDKDDIFPILLRKWLIGAVGRILRPGNQDDQNPVLVLDGPQGIGKSRFVWWLGTPMPAFFYQGAIVADEKDCAIRQCSTFVWELEELGSTFRRSDLNSLKAFLTHPTVRVRVPYGKRDIVKPVTASYIGTINNVAGFLADPTGHRRFRVCTLTSIDWNYDQWIDVNQIWAQAVALWKNGETSALEKETSQLVTQINEKYEVDDPIAAAIFKWFNINPEQTDKTITTNEIIKELRSTSDVTGEGDRAVAMRISEVLVKCGCEKTQIRINDKPVRAWQGVWAKEVTPPKGGL